VVTTRADGFLIGGRRLGTDSECFVIAEAGVNHNGDLALAHQLVDVAADAAADAVKFQTFTPERLVAPDAHMAPYQIANVGLEQPQIAMLRRLVLPLDGYRQLRDHTHERGLVFLSTPFDAESADLLESLEVAAFKVPSGELTNLPFLAYLAGKRRPLLISTGMSRLSEVAEAVEVVRANGDPPQALLHCVSDYPAKARDCNLRAMATMRSLFGVPVGWSDHSQGLHVGIAAAALGAALVEKHFTLDRALPGPDHRASLEPPELREFVRAVREVRAALGDGIKRPVLAEQACITATRRSVHAARDLPQGHVLAVTDLVYLRPGNGIPPSRSDDVIGRRLKASVSAGTMLSPLDLE